MTWLHGAELFWKLRNTFDWMMISFWRQHDFHLALLLLRNYLTQRLIILNHNHYDVTTLCYFGNSDTFWVNPDFILGTVQDPIFPTSTSNSTSKNMIDGQNLVRIAGMYDKNNIMINYSLIAAFATLRAYLLHTLANIVTNLIRRGLTVIFSAKTWGVSN